MKDFCHNNETEVWLPVVGYEDRYEVSNLGRVRSFDLETTTKSGGLYRRRGVVLKPIFDRTSTLYNYVKLHKNGKAEKKAIHRVVLEAFVGPPPGPNYQACHNDGSRTNSRLDNLRWDTIKENAADVARHGNRKRGEECPKSKLTELQAREILSSQTSSLRLAKELGIASSTIRAIRIGQNWRHLQNT